MRLSYIVSKIEGLTLIRDGEFDSIDCVNSKNDHRILTFVKSSKYISQLSKNITSIICTKDILPLIFKEYGVVISKDPRRDFYNINNFLVCNHKNYSRKEFKTTIGKNCFISDNAVISDSNVNIGDNVIIEDFAVIKKDVTIGDNCIIRSGCVIGGEGFQFNKDGKIFFVKHTGGVIIKENVELQYNTCVDKAVFPWDDTIIGEECKIDNLVHIGHCSKINKKVLIAAGSVVGGNCIIGVNSWIGTNCNIRNRVIIGDHASIKMGAVVTKNVEKGQSVSGNFAIQHSKFIKHIKDISKN